MNVKAIVDNQSHKGLKLVGAQMGLKRAQGVSAKFSKAQRTSEQPRGEVSARNVTGGGSGHGSGGEVVLPLCQKANLRVDFAWTSFRQMLDLG